MILNEQCVMFQQKGAQNICGNPFFQLNVILHKFLDCEQNHICLFLIMWVIPNSAVVCYFLRWVDVFSKWLVVALLWFHIFSRNWSVTNITFTPLVICYNVLLHIKLQTIYLGQSQFQEGCDTNCKCDTKMHLLCWRQRKQLMKDSFSSLLKLDFERQCCPYCLLWLMCSVLYYMFTWLLQNRALPTNLPTSWMSRPVPVLPWDRL